MSRDDYAGHCSRRFAAGVEHREYEIALRSQLETPTEYCTYRVWMEDKNNHLRGQRCLYSESGDRSWDHRSHLALTSDIPTAGGGPESPS